MDCDPVSGTQMELFKEANPPVDKNKHYLKHLARLQKRKGILITAFDLWKLAKKQKMKCPYTGRPLIKGDIHVDHITPKCKGGLNDISNLQLLPSEINYFKSGYMEDKWIRLCKEVAQQTQIAADLTI